MTDLICLTPEGHNAARDRGFEPAPNITLTIAAAASAHAAVGAEHPTMTQVA